MALLRAVSQFGLTANRVSALSTLKRFSHNFAGKRAVVTGAGKGIGFDVTKALAESGAEVVALTRSAGDIQLLADIGKQVTPIQADLADFKGTIDALKDVGSLDLVVNNAGITDLTPFVDTDPEKFSEVLDVNVRGALVVSQIAARSMIARGSPGSIVNVSSQASTVGLPLHAAYCSSKGALDQLTRVMAVELGPHNIRTNCVNPTVVLTAMGKEAWSDPEKAAPMLARIPLGRFADTNDVVDPILFLLSEESSMCNGVMLNIDGGFWAA
eukprot:m.341282 g.341282  ORF g.341282 m.341282 type:complete len:270 (+) comp19980_c0_seq1:53-862(+)